MSLLTVTALLALALPASAQWSGYLSKSGTGTGTTNSDAIFGASVGKEIRLVSVRAATDLAAGPILLLSGTEAHTMTVSSATANLPVGSVGTVAANDVLVIHTSANTLTTRICNSVTGTTNIELTAVPGATLAIGTKIYRMSDVQTILPGTTNQVAWTGECLKKSLIRMPLMVRVIGTAACTLQSAAVRYDP